MPVPKRRTSRSNTRHRRSQWKAVPVTTAPCPRCRAAKLPHAVCQNCGTYDGRQILAV
jgi:large subunit ribosomal protein L32